MSPAVPVLRSVDVEPPDEATPGALNLPADFYEARPALAQIRQAAHARLVPADAVFGVVLSRVAALTAPQIVLPPTVASQASLNLFVSLVGPPNVGKSGSKRVGCELTPCDDPTFVDDVPLGSGEGLVDVYFDLVEEGDGKAARKIKRQTRTAAWFYVDEGQALAEMAGRKGSTLMPTLRSAWTGDTLGQANASMETRRRLAAHSYRLALVTGFQPHTAAELLSGPEIAAGSPQRFLWFWTSDATIPADAPSWPGPLDWERPTVNGYAGLTFDNTLGLAPQITSAIRAAALDRNRGTTIIDAIEAHAELARLKVAALLGLLDGRRCVTVDDWDLAGVVTATSAAVRTFVLGKIQSEAIQREQAATLRAVRRELTIEGSKEQRALESMARSIGRQVHKAGVADLRAVQRATAHKHRQLATVEDAIALAIVEGWIVRHEGEFRPGKSRPV